MGEGVKSGYGGILLATFVKMMYSKLHSEHL